ncbi:MAG: OmpA family protein [Panacagrimonas sp.]
MKIALAGSARGLLFGLAGLLPLSTQAGDGFYLGLQGGANFAEDQRFKIYDYDLLVGGLADGTELAENGFDTGWVGGLVAGYAFTSGLRLELNLDRRHDEFDSVDTANGGESDVVEGEEDTDTAMLNLWLDFNKSGSVHPYIGGGAGAAKTKISDPAFDGSLLVDGTALRTDDDTVFAWQAGAGVGFDLGAHWVASLDYRYLKGDKGDYDVLANNPESHIETRYESHAAMLTLAYYFKDPTPAPVEEPPPVAVVAPVLICSDSLDNDGDGLIDYPQDPGCSAADDGDETDPKACSDGKDNDGDGRVDHPGDPGCDSADDNDEADPCQAPKPGEPITLAGCKAGDTIVLRGVNFDFDKASLTTNAKTILDQVVEALKARPDVKVEIQGHTDGKGSDAYNQRLSERRAQSVKQYLVGHGIDTARTTSVGLGEAVPVADNETDEGRELNRRVELKITEGGAGVIVAPPTGSVEAAPPAADAAATAEPVVAEPAATP